MARRARRDEAGFTGVEALLLLPLVALFVDFVFFCGRAGLAREDVYGAARDAARAASVAPSADAPSAASQAAVSSGQAVCPNPVVQTDLSHFARGGVVTVTVTCQIPVSDLDLLGVAGSTTLQSSYTEAVDPLTAADR